MSYLESILLGLVQGLTEFIPISSSGHLILTREFLGLQAADALAVDAIFQLATILAVGVYFFRDLISMHKDRVLLKAVMFGTIPAIILGLLLEEKMETVFRSAHLVAWMLLAGSALMYIAERLAKEDSLLTTRKGLFIGLFQALALIPGVSRSGATISGGLINGLSRASAARFSFILSFPIIFGSGLKKFFELDGLVGIGASVWTGSFVAFVVGLGAIHFLIQYLKNHKLTPFIWYRVVLALVILLFV